MKKLLIIISLLFLLIGCKPTIDGSIIDFEPTEEDYLLIDTQISNNLKEHGFNLTGFSKQERISFNVNARTMVYWAEFTKEDSTIFRFQWEVIENGEKSFHYQFPRDRLGKTGFLDKEEVNLIIDCFSKFVNLDEDARSELQALLEKRINASLTPLDRKIILDRYKIETMSYYTKNGIYKEGINITG